MKDSIHRSNDILTALLGLLVLLAAGCSPTTTKFIPTVEDGRLDLTSWHFQRDGTIPLKGLWRFQPNELLEPQPLESLKNRVPKSFQVPAGWASYPSHASGAHERISHGTYFLELKLPSHAFAGLTLGSHGLPFYSAGSVQLLRTDGTPLSHTIYAGRPGNAPEHTIAEISKWDAEIPHLSPGETVVILIHVSNFHHAAGGFWTAPILGESTAIQSKNRISNTMSALLIGILFVMALYHLVIFTLRRQDRASLYFTAVCVSTGLREVVMSRLFPELGFANSALAYEVLTKIEYITMPLSLISINAFIGCLVPGAIFKKTNFVFHAVGLSLIAFTLVTSSLFFTSFLALFQVYVLLGILIALVHLTKETFKETRYAGIILAAALVLMAAVTNDVLYAQSVIDTGHIAPFIIILWVIIKSSLISKNYARVFEERDSSMRSLLRTYEKLKIELENRERLSKENEQLQLDISIASEQLIQADKLSTLGTLAAGVAHDIANPASAIYLQRSHGQESNKEARELLLSCMEGSDDEESKALLQGFQELFGRVDKSFQVIQTAAERIQSISGAIRNQSRTDSEMDLHELKPLFDECITMVSNKLRDIQIEILCPDEVNIDMKRSQMGQVLMNLVSNAADAIASREAIRESATKQVRLSYVQPASGPWKIAVEDSGDGIPEEIREDILKPFFTTKEVGKGTGLGMPIIIRILENHHYQLDISDSEDLGGACMVITPKPAAQAVPSA